VIPLGAYDGELRDAVLKTKRLLHENVSIALGHLLAHRRKGAIADFGPDLIVPIPMHWRRRFRRGTNSPEVLARCLGKHLGVPVAVGLLVRTRNTKPQMELLPGERFHNVRGAFRVRRVRRWRLKGSRILLLDDILTTGATCSEAADVLKRSGAAAVAAAVIAKAQFGR
jgi:ComF family protein